MANQQPRSIFIFFGNASSQVTPTSQPKLLHWRSFHLRRSALRRQWRSRGIPLRVASCPCSYATHLPRLITPSTSFIDQPSSSRSPSHSLSISDRLKYHRMSKQGRRNPCSFYHSCFPNSLPSLASFPSAMIIKVKVEVALPHPLIPFRFLCLSFSPHNHSC